jgi:hypothetical protein
MTQPEAIPIPAASAHTLKDYYERHEREIALAAFVAGFLFDVLTLPRVDSWLAIGQQALYIVVIMAVLVHMLVERAHLPETGETAGPKHWYRRYRTVLVHFLFGSLLNLYTIYYFKSSSLLASFSFMVVLVFLLAANETRRFKSLGLAFKFALLSLCVLSFSAHVTPIFAGSIGPLVFLGSMLVGSVPLIGVALGVRARAPDRFALARAQILAPQGFVLAGFLVFYLFRLIPPVPLSMPFIGVYHAIERSAQGYRLSHERPRWRFWHNGDQEFLAQPGDRVYVFFRIYSPTRFSDQVQARWYWKDESGSWAPQDTNSVSIVGGRAQGFRGYGYKSNYRAGNWKVQVETTDGREIGRIYFRLSLAPAAPRVFVTELQ